MKRFISKSQRIGELGEQIAQKFLLDKGFHIIECNYTKRVGEIDIVALKNGVIHFVEVKTLISVNVPRETLDYQGTSRTKGPGNAGGYTPFQNIGTSKMKKLSKTCALYLMEKHVSHETRWVMDAIAVTVSHETKTAKVEVLWNMTG